MSHLCLGPTRLPADFPHFVALGRPLELLYAVNRDNDENCTAIGIRWLYCQIKLWLCWHACCRPVSLAVSCVKSATDEQVYMVVRSYRLHTWYYNEQRVRYGRGLQPVLCVRATAYIVSVIVRPTFFCQHQFNASAFGRVVCWCSSWIDELFCWNLTSAWFSCASLLLLRYAFVSLCDSVSTVDYSGGCFLIVHSSPQDAGAIVLMFWNTSPACSLLTTLLRVVFLVLYTQLYYDLRSIGTIIF